jgi:DNA-binding LacI/PurR family transcriptional regulator
MPAKLADVARHAGLSIATVSRVLSGKANVSEASRQRVLAAAAELDYRPSRTARSLRERRGHVIGIIITDVQNPFFATVVRAVEDIVYQHKYAFWLCNTDEDPDKESAYVDLMLSEHVAGVIVSPTSETDNSCRRLAEAEIPVVAIDRRTLQAEVDTVVVDNVRASRELVSHLLEIGHRRIGAVLGTPTATTGHERRAGYEQALKTYGLEVNPELVRAGPPTQEFGEKATHELLDMEEPPTALFTGNNLLTLGVLCAVSERNLRAPDDIGVAAFDGMDWMSLVCPMLPIVSQPAEEMGRTAARLLLARMADATREPQEVMLRAVVRLPHYAV